MTHFVTVRECDCLNQVGKLEKYLRIGSPHHLQDSSFRLQIFAIIQ